MSFMNWIDERFPATKVWNEHLAQYYAPKNFNFWYFFGSLALLVLVIQIVTGIFLTMNYKPDATQAFASVEYIMRDVEWGWLIRYMHSTGASFFFILVYLHMFRSFLYGSHRAPRELVWIFGMLIYLALMAEAFMGYVLPWGQMSYWGAQVIISLFGAVPGIGDAIVEFIRGDYSISDITLNRFFALHVIALPLALIGLIFVHIVALHEVGSNNPDGIEIKENKGADGIPLDGVAFHPYHTSKDLVAIIVFLMIFCSVVFFAPDMGGYFLEHANFVPADPLKTPEHIAPVWYFTPFYTVLRAVPDPFLGVIAMGAAVVILFFLPWIDQNPIKSMRYRSPLHFMNLLFFAASFIYLGYLGVNPPEPVLAEMGLRFSEVYFLFFFVLWFHSKSRGASFSYASLIVLVGIYSLYDLVRISEGNMGLVTSSWLIPTGYMAIMLLAPLFTNLNQEKPVPERLTK